jgi:hypothetical protein
MFCLNYQEIYSSLFKIGIQTDKNYALKYSLGNQLLSKNVAEMQLLTNHLCKHCLLALYLW